MDQHAEKLTIDSLSVTHVIDDMFNFNLSNLLISSNMIFQTYVSKTEYNFEFDNNNRAGSTLKSY